MAPPHACDSAVSPCSHDCPAFLHLHFPPRSPPSYPLNPFLCTQQQPASCNCSITPKLQLPAAAPSRGPVFLSEVCMAAARDVWVSFHLGCHRSAVSLSALNVSPLTQTVAQMWRLDPPRQFPYPPRAGPVLLTLFFPLVPSSCRVLCGSVYSLPLVRYFLCSQLPFCTHFCVWRCILIYPWREMYSKLTYSSAILFSQAPVFLLSCENRHVNNISFQPMNLVYLSIYLDFP